MDNFLSLLVNKKEEQVTTSLKMSTLDDLSLGNVVINVHYSSINYKDALATQTNGGVIRDYPMIPGVDLSGTIISSDDNRFSFGQKVLVTGYHTGVSHTGGFAELARIPADWIVPLPNNLTLKDAMILGTAGFTAALSIQQLEEHGLSSEKDAPILVTGATGGVGSLSISMLKQFGYTNITALTRKKEQVATLVKLGARNVLISNDFFTTPKALMKQQFKFVIDTVGGKMTEQILPQLYYNGCLALSGNVGGNQLSTTVLPFILRGISLLGIDSVNIPMEKRLNIWKRLATDFSLSNYFTVNEVMLKEVPKIIEKLKNTSHYGRTIICMEKEH